MFVSIERYQSYNMSIKTCSHYHNNEISIDQDAVKKTRCLNKKLFIFEGKGQKNIESKIKNGQKVIRSSAIKLNSDLILQQCK